MEWLMDGGKALWLELNLNNNTVQHFFSTWINKVFSDGLFIAENESGGQIGLSRQVSEKIEIKYVPNGIFVIFIISLRPK